MQEDKENAPKKTTKKRGPGRPRGKRSDPKFIFLGGYIKRTTYRAVKRRLLREDMEISELLQILLDKWLKP